ncbi:striatin-3-like isoform X2 [Hydractinia symbiolongicarpus]|uniref:striatin-3-like isoform X2 n=1 Tax=Hydractinia symbiolongicarpus TaxID=13093 RepID=UPI00254E0FC8|nr:striatin-3-like isoform X2 [Hydractinia symbiolongicarpus]
MENEPSPNSNGGNRNGLNVTENVNNINRPTYTIPGILHYVQHEWARFDMERAHWEVERAELQARIAFLQGERKGQENLKRDLVRRIKMLEFALRQERQKFHKLKYGTDLKLPEVKNNEEEENSMDNLIINKNHDLVFNYRQGRQLLRQYLQEIGYTDKVLDMRSARVRSLLGITTDDLPPDANENLVSARESRLKKQENRHAVAENENDLKNAQNINHEPEQDANQEHDDEILRHSIKSKDDPSVQHKDDDVLKNFDFLGQEEVPAEQTQGNDQNDEWGNYDSGKLQKRIQQFKNETKDRAKRSKRPSKDALKTMLQNFNAEEEIPPPPQIPAPPVPNAKGGENMDIDEGTTIGDVALPSSGYSPRQIKPGLVNHSGAVVESVEVAIGLGELAGLTVTNEAGSLIDTSGRDEVRKTWGPKYTLRSHFDGVRSLCFHPYESALITASEDHTLKLWSLQKYMQGRKGNISDLEPVYTFRGHSGPVLCCVINSNGSVCYSGGMDSTIQCWNLPSLNIDLFGPYDPNLFGETLVAHTDAVWDLAYHIDTDYLLSCSADGACKLWNPSSKSPLLESYSCEGVGKPTSVSFINTDTGQIASSYTSEQCVIFDMETAKPVVTFGSMHSGNSSQINKVVSHPTSPMVITAHEDRHIRFFDINSGKEVHNMVAHLDAVTSLSIDPSGLYILSGSHDGSIRLWNMDNKTCIQEITAHRKKFDEAVFDVAFHPTQPYIASAGADALAKVFV